MRISEKGNILAVKVRGQICTLTVPLEGTMTEPQH